jgi:quercetin dioxygenase-like cupin family protein
MGPTAGARGPLLHRSNGETITDRKAREVVLLADREQLSISWSRYARSECGPEPHVHREHVDSFYVLDGELGFKLGPGADPVRLQAGGFLAVPPNLVHSFANEGADEARFLNFHAPDGGFAEFLRAGRDGGEGAFDSFNPPPGGGLPATEAVLRGPKQDGRARTGNPAILLEAALPKVRVSEWELEGPSESGRQATGARVDALYMLAGQLEVAIGADVHRAAPETLVLVAPGSEYAFSNRGSNIARVLSVQAPAKE